MEVIMLGALIGAGASLVGGFLSSRSQKSAAREASEAQQAMSREAIAEQRRQFDKTRELLSPYVDTGKLAMNQYASLLGLNDSYVKSNRGAGFGALGGVAGALDKILGKSQKGVMSQADAISQIENSPFLQSQYKQAENALLQNAAATGGLRGGNVQEALADNRMNMLYQNVQNQQQHLANLANLGQNAAAGVGNAGMATGNNIANQLNGIGQAQAGYALARGQANNSLLNGFLGGVGIFGKAKGMF